MLLRKCMKNIEQSGEFVGPVPQGLLRVRGGLNIQD